MITILKIYMGQTEKGTNKYWPTIVGVILLAAGIFWVNANINFLDGSVETSGMVVDYTRTYEIEDGEGNYYYRKVVEFETKDDEKIKFTNNIRTGVPPILDVPVQVVYHENNPPKAMIKSFASLWLGGLLLIVFGALSLLFGLALLLKATRVKK